MVKLSAWLCGWLQIDIGIGMCMRRCMGEDTVSGDWYVDGVSVWQGGDGTSNRCVREGMQEWLSDDPEDRWRAW